MLLDCLHCSTSELLAFLLDSLAGFLTSEQPALNVHFVGDGRGMNGRCTSWFGNTAR